MTAYIIKIVLCSGLLILIYHLLLEREKIYKFNRGYLLFSIAFSFIIPLISIKVSSSVGLIPGSFYQTNTVVQNTIPQQPLPYVGNAITVNELLLLVYVAVTAFFFFKFFINVFSLFNKIRHSKSVPYSDAKIVLTEDKLVPYSFLKFIFINNEDFVTGKIENEILSHELTHVKQKHSFDILFIELLLIFAWINPLLFLYRKAIQLNHEFLADESVVKEFNDAKNYQLLLIYKALQPNRLMLSSQFNYLQTKKRIIMMSKKGSFKAAILKQIALIPVIVATGFLFTTKVIAQDKENTLNQQQVESTRSGVSQELLKEYQDILNTYKKTLTNGKESYSLNLSQGDKERLEKIFLQMSKEQQANQMFIFVPANSEVLSRIVPTNEQLISFKDPKMYGVWIDGKRVNNDVLNNYKNTDFAFVMSSKLAKNATNYGKHVYQVNLMTNDDYQKYYDETIARKGYICRLNFIKKDDTNSQGKIYSDASTPIISTSNQQDTDFENWWKSTAKKHGINYESFTVHEPYVIFGKKTIDNNIESFNDVVAIGRGLSFKKGKNYYSIVKSDKATYGFDSEFKNVVLKINNCVMQQFDGNSNSTDPTESRTLKIFVAEVFGQRSK